MVVKKRSRLSAADKEIYARQVQICKAFANTTRLQMLDLVAHREWPVGDLQKELQVSKPNLSQHLAILRGAGVISTRREGKHVYCTLAIPEVKQACKLIKGVLRAQLKRGQKLAV